MQLKNSTFGADYITQAAPLGELEDEYSRIYVTRLRGVNLNVADYRGASAEEKAQWEATYANQEPTDE